MKQERLLYLSSSLKVPTVPRQLQSYIPLYDLINQVQELGLVGYSATNDVSYEQLVAMCRKGSQAGDGTVDEFKAIVASLVWSGVTESDLLPKEKTAKLAILNQWVQEKSTSLVDREVASFDRSLPIGNENFMFETGFEPLDTLTGGLPENSFTLLLAGTAAGKTSIMLALANALAANYRVVFVSIEMSAKAVRYRAKNCTNLSGKDVLLTGSVSISDLEEYATENTIIIVDYLALVTSSVNGELRHKLTDVAQGMLRLSTKCKAVVSAHQARREEKELTVDSLSEAYSVSWYPSLIIGIKKGGQDYDNPGYTSVTLNSAKNRYGKANSVVAFPFHYGTLDSKPVSSNGEMGVDYDTNW